MSFGSEIAFFRTLDFHPKQHSTLHRCLNQHEECRANVGVENFLPKRLVDLGEDEDKIVNTRLVCTRDVKSRPLHYMTVTHSWSTLSATEQESLVTTLENHDSRTRTLDIHAFPSNYQAVMVLCKSFGIRYLWMDSICIVQPSNEDKRDWEEESIRMRGIYGSAVLTVSINTQQDLYTMERTLETQPEWENLRLQVQKSALQKGLFVKLMLESGPVGKRAWCLQERHLSPRLLHLLDNGIIPWECSKGQWTTNSPPLFKSRAKENYVVSKIAKSKRVIDLEKEDESGMSWTLSNQLYYWYDFLSDYQRRSLTYAGDNLAAIVGIAESMQARTGWTYLSGLWEEDLPRGLLWECNPSSTTAHNRFETFHAPTWCWSSVTGPTRMLPGLMDSDGDISSARRSFVKDIVVINPPTSGSTASLSFRAALQVVGYLEECVCSGQGTHRQILPQTTQDTKRHRSDQALMVKYGSIHFDVPKEAFNGPVWCLPLAEFWNLGPEACAGIALRRVEEDAGTRMRSSVRQLVQSLVPMRQPAKPPLQSAAPPTVQPQTPPSQSPPPSIIARIKNRFRSRPVQTPPPTHSPQPRTEFVGTFRRVGLVTLDLDSSTKDELLDQGQTLRLI